MIVAPIGRTNFTERLSTPASRAHFIVKGNVADELAVPKAVNRARNNEDIPREDVARTLKIYDDLDFN